MRSVRMNRGERQTKYLSDCVSGTVVVETPNGIARPSGPAPENPQIGFRGGRQPAVNISGRNENRSGE